MIHTQERGGIGRDGRYNVCKGSGISWVERTAVKRVGDIPCGHVDGPITWIRLPYALEEAWEASPNNMALELSNWLVEVFTEDVLGL